MERGQITVMVRDSISVSIGIESAEVLEVFSGSDDKRVWVFCRGDGWLVLIVVGESRRRPQRAVMVVDRVPYRHIITDLLLLHRSGI
jgi:hypothetical protein